MATSPLIEAVVANNIRECRRLLETEEGMETIDDRDQYEEEFNEYGGSLDHIDDRPIGLTALMHACKGGYLNIAELLLSKGAVVDRRDIKERYTALMMASYHNRFERAKLLISEGGGEEVDLRGNLCFSMDESGVCAALDSYVALQYYLSDSER